MIRYVFKTPKECAWCIRLPEGLFYSGLIGAWEGIHSVVDYPDFEKVCKAIEASIVKREKSYEKYCRKQMRITLLAASTPPF